MPGPIEQFRTYIDGLQPGQRIVLVGAAVIALMVLVGVGVWGLQDKDEVVFRSGDPGKVQSVAEALTSQDIPHAISGDGLAITVPPEFTGRARRVSRIWHSLRRPALWRDPSQTTFLPTGSTQTALPARTRIGCHRGAIRQRGTAGSCIRSPLTVAAGRG